RLRGGPADAPPGAGDDGDLSFESWHFASSYPSCTSGPRTTSGERPGDPGRRSTGSSPHATERRASRATWWPRDRFGGLAGPTMVPAMADQITVLIVDDHRMFAEALRLALELEDGVRVAGVATGYDDAGPA